MVKCITIGKFNKNYFFLLGSVLVRLIKSLINGFNPGLVNFRPIYLFNHKPFFSRHPFFTQFLQYFSFALIGFILEKIYYRNNNNNNNNNNNKLSNDKEDESTENNNDAVDSNDDINKNIALDNIDEINDKKNFLKIFLAILFCFLAQIIFDKLNNLI